MKPIYLTLLILFTIVCTSYAQNTKQVVYKQIDTTKLTMVIYTPPDFDKGENYPALAFFFGGGWKGGSTKQFEPHAKYFSKRGIVCFLVNYRVESRDKATPFESLKDARSAIRYIRGNAGLFKIDPNRIIASGGSAGGHLAAATALTDKYDDERDDLDISCVPDALVLFNPVIDNGPGGYGFERIGMEYKDFSPLHNINSGAPPTIFFLGTQDALIPVETAQYYKKVMEKVGSRCELRLYEGEGHGFFNYKNFENYKSTVSEADKFLISIGFLEKEPEVQIE